MCGGTPTTPPTPPPAPAPPPEPKQVANTKQPKGRRRSSDSATFSSSRAAAADKARGGQAAGTLLSQTVAGTGNTLLGA